MISWLKTTERPITVTKRHTIVEVNIGADQIKLSKVEALKLFLALMRIH